MAESLFATLKAERIDQQSWPTQQAVHAAVFAGIAVLDNRQRRHSTCGYLSPAEFAARLTGGQLFYR